MRQLAFVLVMLLLFPQSGLAQSTDKTGFAVSGGVGMSVIRDEDGAETFDDNQFGYQLAIEYRFVPQFALGVSVFTLGTGEDTFNGEETEIEVDGVDLFGRIILPISEGSDIYGLIGRATYFADVTPGFEFEIFGEEAWLLGGGLDFDVAEDFALRIEGRYYDGPDDESGGLVTVGFSYRF